ncbi:MAG: VRR-NUC domain-containing protein [Clostridia bacterium]|nr:VRR-NUC domain-containing protein [Clostridia bacterium]
MMTEADVQNSIRLKLSELGYYTERINVGSGYLVPKELMDKIKRLCPQLKAELDRISYFSTGAVKGRSDISAIKDGKIAFLEIKNEKGRPTAEQLKFIEVMQTRYGCRAGVARSVSDALAIVEGANNG